MTLQDIYDDIQALKKDLEAFEHKYRLPSETFYELYLSGEEPENDAWVLDWADWAGACKLLQRRKEKYRHTFETLLQEQSLTTIIEKINRGESIPVV